MHLSSDGALSQLLSKAVSVRRRRQQSPPLEEKAGKSGDARGRGRTERKNARRAGVGGWNDRTRAWYARREKRGRGAGAKRSQERKGEAESA